MENAEKAKHIIEIIRLHAGIKIAEYVRAEADLARAETGSRLWEEENENDFRFDYNPYNVELEKKKVKRILKEKLAREEVLAYAINIFLNKI